MHQGQLVTLDYLPSKLFRLISSKGSVFCTFLRHTCYSVHGAYVAGMISSGNILYASWTQSIIYFHKTGGGLLERRLNRAFMISSRYTLNLKNAKISKSLKSRSSAESWRARVNRTLLACYLDAKTYKHI